MSLVKDKLDLKAGQAVYITPFTPMSEKLKRHLVQHSDVTVLGFVDKSKQGEDIIHPDQLVTEQFDNVLIISPNYGLEIFKGLHQSGIAKSKLQLVIYSGVFSRISALKLWWQKTKDDALPRIHLFLQRYVQKALQRDDRALFLCQGFIDLNIKELYLYFSAQPNVRAAIATDNQQQIEQLRKVGFKVIPIKSLQFIYYSLRAKLKILDHTPLTKDLRYAILGSKTIQIWHGIPLKKIGHLANYNIAKYDLMISTSDFVTEYAFSKVFDYKKVTHSGYPRNDILIQQRTDEKSLAMVEHDIYQWIQNSNKKLIIYMPTWRGDSFENNPINLEQLNLFAKQHDLIILMKMHPFIRPESFFDTMETDDYQFTSGYQQNVVFYPSINDIYPLLAMSSMLITDYSSIYFDYLLLDKPILFFIYDKDDYVKRQGDFMLDFDAYTPGLKPTDMPSLQQAILTSLQRDEFKQDRATLTERLYEQRNIGHSSAVIYDEAIELLHS
ncbi:CDP-glycerol glycerophosphotransferase family protein [Neptunicella sp.]|uniref:CDP-glycerol glycerophosphotransferase family protein n=1 Tax=Neptunicella sp. TaxID=2125986 RepID=UPI003F68C2E0